jgi:hypothetical protein
MALVPGRYNQSPIARAAIRIKAIVDHSIETVPARTLDSRTRGLLRRIMRRVRPVMGADGTGANGILARPLDLMLMI